MIDTDKLRTVQIEPLIKPVTIIKRYPISSAIAEHVSESRKRIRQILTGIDHRLLVIIGPCSIHDLDSAMDYAVRLQIARKKYCNRLEIVMRTYFEKPRTVLGWKGLMSDPDLNDKHRINYGIELARLLLLKVNELNVPTGTEFLNTVTSQFIKDLISWGAIGARTTESQIHREMASSLACPVGFKNGTDGNVRIAVDAIRVARCSHVFISPDQDGQMAICQTSGNQYGHIIMRGGKKKNYYKQNIAAACKLLSKFKLPEYLVVDFSHANCKNSPKDQLEVCDEICHQIRNGSTSIVGIMAESFICGGAQKIANNKSIIYGQSITDPCLSWEDSEVLLKKLVHAVESRF